MQHRPLLEKRVRLLLQFYGLVLIVVGLTTFPLQPEVALLERLAGAGSLVGELWPAMGRWVSTIGEAVAVGYGTYPLLQYGTDWLAFAHIVIGIAFLGAARDPVRNVWIVEWGMIACILIIPTALLFGAIRGIPVFWRMLDCAFGVLGIVPLWLARAYIARLARPQSLSGGRFRPAVRPCCRRTFGKCQRPQINDRHHQKQR